MAFGLGFNAILHTGAFRHSCATASRFVLFTRCLLTLQFVLTTFFTFSIAGKKCVAGPDGAISSKSIDCIAVTVQSLDIILSRLRYLNSTNMEQLQLFTAVNESAIEHGFAAQPFNTQHTFLDYAIGQRNNRLKMLQDHSVTEYSCPKQYRKSYFETPTEGCLASREVSSLVKELSKELANGPKFVVISSKTSKGDVARTKLLSAVNVAKSQPRQTTRGKYKQEAGYKPVMNHQSYEDPGNKVIFYKNDLLPYKDYDGTSRLMLVEEDITQKDFIDHKAVVGKPVQTCQEHDECLHALGEKRISVEECNLMTSQTNGQILSCPSIHRAESVCFKVPETFLNDINDLDI